LWIGLSLGKEDLEKKIDKRVEERVEKGALEEIKGLLDKGYGW
jgi:tRNA A37 N6-isopentenylltransferase MiaA